MGGAPYKVEIGNDRGTNRGTEKRVLHSVGGPAIERTPNSTVPRLEVGWRDPLLMNDFGLETGQELLIQNPDDLVRIFRGFLGPVDGGGVSWRVDQKEVVVVIGRSRGRVGTGANAEVNRGILCGAVFAKHLLEFEWVVIGEENVVVGQSGVFALHPKENDKA